MTETGMTTDAFRSHAARAEINVTPLIDVLLALVVILIVAAPIALRRLPLPGDSHRSGNPHTLALSILSTGELYLEGVAVNRAQLADTLSVEAAAAQPPVLEIRSDANTPYEKVADTLALAQRSGLGISILDTRAVR